MDIIERLKLIRSLKHISQAKLASALGIPQSTYANYESGKALIPDELKLALARLYNINLNWLLLGMEPIFNDGATPSEAVVKTEDEDTLLIPMTNVKLSAGMGMNWDEGIYTGEMIPIPRKIARNYNSAFLIAAEVRGNSMEPTLKDGETVVYAKGQMEGDGIYAIAIYDELYIKRIALDLLDRKVLIISDNEKYPTKEYPIDKEGLTVLGKVVFWIHEE